MRNCIILGSGRSGTSMIAGSLVRAGYYMGDELYAPRKSNPKGFFEGPQINSINEELLSQVVPTNQALNYGQRWLALLPPGTQFFMTPEIERAIITMIKHQPYCFKDPRFSYTLPAWKPYLQNVTCICVFREPGATAESIQRECTDEYYLANVKMSFFRALNIWAAIYNNILNIQDLHNHWIFVHYNQFINGEGINRISQQLKTPVDRYFPDSSLHRSHSTEQIPHEIMTLYHKLCELAEYKQSG